METGNSGRVYRSPLEIVRDVLLVAAEAGDGGSKKTHIMYGANLSYKLLKKYLGKALDSGLICEGSSCFLITEKGREFLHVYGRYEKLHEALRRNRIELSDGREELEKLLALTE